MNTSFEKQGAHKTTTTWLTPIEIIRSLGEFDLDPCTPPTMPWETAKQHYTEKDNGLVQHWFGRVWLNPPYGSDIMAKFLEKMALHGNGIALTFTRLETKQFHQWVFPYADALFFKRGRIHFLNEAGIIPSGTNGPGVGSVFIAYGRSNVFALRDSGMDGKLVLLNQNIRLQ